MAGDNMIRSYQLERLKFYNTHYDYMTGLRIAATLGGFFLFVLLTLLYKSKCKKSSRDPTPDPMFSQPRTHPDLVVLKSNPCHQPIEEVNPMLQHHLFLDHQQPGPSHHHNHFQSPKLLLTAAHDSSESSIESELSLTGYYRRGSNSSSSKYQRIPTATDTSTYNYKKKVSQPTQQMSLLQQNIDIHVIQPTPTISPSGSANIFHKPSKKKSKKSQSFRPSYHSADSEFSANANPLFFLQAESLSIKYMDDTSSENIPTRGADLEDDGSGESFGSDSVFSYERKISQASFTDEQDEGDGEVCRVTLTEAQAQVHHRDSFCSSEYESITDYLECHRRRSSSTQTTWSDLRQCLGFGHVSSGNVSPQFPPGTSAGTRRHNSVGHGHDDCLITVPSPNNTATSSSSMLLTPIIPLHTSTSASGGISPLETRRSSTSRKQSTNSLQESTISPSTTTINTGLVPTRKNSSQTTTTEVAGPSQPKALIIPSTNKEVTIDQNEHFNTNPAQQGKSSSKRIQTIKKTQCDDDHQHLFKEQ